MRVTTQQAVTSDQFKFHSTLFQVAVPADSATKHNGQGLQ